MDVTMIQSMITSIGFPIVAVMGLAWFIYRAFEKFTVQSEKREDKLCTVIVQAQKVNEKLTKTNAEFVEVLHSYRDDLDAIKTDVSEIKQNMKG